MLDERIKTLAKNLINYSCNLQTGEKLLIEAHDVADMQLIKELVKEAYKVGAYPVVRLQNSKVTKELLMGTSKEHSILLAKHIIPQMEEMDAYIAIGGGKNVFEYSGVPHDKVKIYAEHYSKPIHRDIRVE